MTWFANSLNESEADKAHYFPFVAVDFDFPSGHYRYWSGAGELVINGNTFEGLGEFVAVEGEPDSVELGPQRRTYTLSHVDVDPAIIDENDIDNSFGRDVVEYLGFLNPETRQLVATPEIFWEGRIDSFSRTDGASPIIKVTAEHRLALLDRSDDWRYTHEHQQEFYPGDNGLDQVNAIMLKKVIWGGKNVDPAIRSPNGPTPRPPPPGWYEP